MLRRFTFSLVAALLTITSAQAQGPVGGGQGPVTGPMGYDAGYATPMGPPSIAPPANSGSPGLLSFEMQISAGTPAGPACGPGCQGCGHCGGGPRFSDTCFTDCQPCFPLNFPWYVSLFGGWSDVDNFERKLRNTITGNLTEISGAGLEEDYAAGGALGWMIHPQARSELEFTYRQNDVDEYHVLDFVGGFLNSETSEPASGRVKGTSGMWNFVVHTEPRSVGCMSLYGGAGIGILWVDGSFSTATDDYTVGDSSFAYQFIGGLNYVVGPRVDSFIEYRYLGADYIEVQNVTSGVSMGDFGYDSHGVFFGIRFGR